MTTVSAISFTYIAYAAMLAIGVICWFGALTETVIFRRVSAELLDPSWRETAFWLARNLRYAVVAAGLCALAGFAAALFPAGEAGPVAASHKAYQLRYGAIAVCFVGLVALSGGRMGEFDAEIAAAAVFAWALWLLAAAWRALATGAAVTGPALWWLALAADLLAFAAFVLVMILLNTRMRLF